MNDLAPNVLQDAYDDPIEERAWVQVTDEIDTGDKAAAYLNDDDSLFDPDWYDDPCRMECDGVRVWLVIEEHDADHEEQRWKPCEADTPDAVEFWALERREITEAVS